MGLPKIERDADADKGPYAVILASTRELAQQVSGSIRPQASRHEGLYVISSQPFRPYRWGSRARTHAYVALYL